MIRVVADTGPLVALLDRSDHFHSWAIECFKGFRADLLTCEPVLTETWHLLHRNTISLPAFAEFCRNGALQIPYSFAAELGATLDLLERYHDTPMDFADACLVRMSELEEKSVVWTLDRDFNHYRRHKRRTIPLLAPWT